MNKQNFEINSFDAFASIIDIDLFNGVVTHIKSMNSNNISDRWKNFILLGRDGYEEDAVLNNKYGYFGEFLERYERILTDKASFRAVALAVAIMREYIKPDMYVGQQYSVFLAKIKPDEHDIYMKGIYYVLHEGEVSEDFYDSLLSYPFKTTEELVFTLALLPDFQTILRSHYTLIHRLIGKERTITVQGNIGIYQWLVIQFAHSIKGMRQREIRLFRSLALLPTMFVKEENQAYQILQDHEYSKEEIDYLSIALILNEVPEISVPIYSIPAEKTALRFLVTHLDSEKIHPQETYDFMEIVINKYVSFQIKIEGYDGIAHMLNHQDFTIKTVETYMWAFGRSNLDDELFVFDANDDRWDPLFQLTEKEKQQRIMDIQIEYGENPKKILEKYEEFTGDMFLKTFNIHSYGRATVFHRLAALELIDLIQIYEGQKQNLFSEDIIKYFECIEMVRSRQAYSFINYYIENFSLKKMKKELSINLASSIFKSSGYYTIGERYRVSFDRTFLTESEIANVLRWAEESAFLFHPRDYDSYLLSYLKSDFVRKHIPFDELRQAYLQIKEIRGRDELHQIYLTEEELNHIKKRKQLEREIRNWEADKRIITRCEQEFMEAEGNVISVLFKKIYFRYEDSQEFLRKLLLKHIIMNQLPNIVEPDEQKSVFHTIGKLVDNGVIPLEKGFGMIKKLEDIKE